MVPGARHAFRASGPEPDNRPGAPRSQATSPCVVGAGRLLRPHALAFDASISLVPCAPRADKRRALTDGHPPTHGISNASP